MKIVKSLLFGFFAWIIFISAVAALEWNGDSSGSGTWDVNCGDTTRTYCYNSSGLRLTLYKISDDKKSVTKKGHSHDFWSPDSPLIYTSFTYFTSTSSDVVNDKIKGTILRSEGKFSIGELVYAATALADRVTFMTGSWPDLLTENARFRAWLDDTDNNPIFKKSNSYKKLKNVFGLTDAQKNDVASNSQKYYLVVEPLFALWKGSGASRPSGFSATRANGSGASYAGTVFDMIVFSPYTSAVMIHAKALYNSTEIGDFVKSGGHILVPAGTSFNENSILLPIFNIHLPLIITFLGLFSIIDLISLLIPLSIVINTISLELTTSFTLILIISPSYASLTSLLLPAIFLEKSLFISVNTFLDKRSFSKSINKESK